MNQPKLSIIVPVYNVEQYLMSCVESIFKQDYRDYELILIDDGSLDHCPELCDQIAAEDSRVRVVHQQNAGIAGARNTGLAIASGEYVVFVDSDDILAEGALFTTINEIDRTNSDVVLGGVTRFDSQGNVRPYTRMTERKEMSGKEALALLLEGKELNISVCSGVFRRSLFTETTFSEGYICEDWYITPELFLKASKVVFVPDHYYCYRVNDDSIMGQLYRKPNQQVIEVAEHVIDVIRKSGDKDLYYQTLWSNLRRVWNYIGRLFNGGYYEEEKEFVGHVRNLLKKYLKDLRKTRSMNFQEKVGVWAFCECELFFKMLRRIRR